MKLQTNHWQRLIAAGTVFPMIAAAPALLGAEGAYTPQGPNRFNVSGRFLFNVSTEFSAPDPGPGLGAHAANHAYGNGFVNVDASGNAGNTTMNWGFQDQASVVGPLTLTPTLRLQSLSAPDGGRPQKETDDPQFGFETSYGRVLHAFDLGGMPLRLGLQGAFGMTLLDIGHDGTSPRVIDTYNLIGLPIIPNAPYIGAPAPVPGGPLPVLLPDAPMTRTPVNAIERMKVGGNLYGFKVGPFLEFPVGKCLALGLQGGFAAMLADADFKWSESVAGEASFSGRASRSEWLYGGFVEGQVAVSLGNGWSTFIGAGWQDLGDLSLPAGAKAAKVKLGNTISATAGINYSF